MKQIKCKSCGTMQEVSRDGWLTDTIINGRREVKYHPWTHIVGHWHPNGKMCSGARTEVYAERIVERRAVTA